MGRIPDCVNVALLDNGTRARRAIAIAMIRAANASRQSFEGRAFFAMPGMHMLEPITAIEHNIKLVSAGMLNL